MLGHYDDAVASFERALALRPAWQEASANRDLAKARGALLDQGGADAGDQREGADEIIYDKTAKPNEGQDTTTQGGPMDDASVRALWLKRIATRPADFLRARFAYQLQAESDGDPKAPAP